MIHLASGDDLGLDGDYISGYFKCTRDERFFFSPYLKGTTWVY